MTTAAAAAAGVAGARGAGADQVPDRRPRPAGRGGAGRPQAARRTVGSGDRDRGGRDRCGARIVGLVGGGAQRRDRRAGHQPAHRPERADLRRRDQRAAHARSADDRPAVGGIAVQDTGLLSGVNAYRSPLIPSIETNALSVDATSLHLPGGGQHLARAGQVPQRCHGEGTRLRAGRGGRAADGHRPDLARRPNLGRRACGSTSPGSSSPRCWPPISTPVC